MKNKFLLAILSVAAINAGCSSNESQPETENAVEEQPMVEQASETKSEPAPEMSNEKAATEQAAPSPAEEKKAVEMAAPAEPEQAAEAVVEYVCMHGQNKRVIRVFENTASGLACEVTYEKASGTKTLWKANNDTAYCEPKAEAFAKKQVGWGWKCADNNGNQVSAPEPEPAPVATPEPEVEPAPVATPAPEETAPAAPAEEEPAPAAEEPVTEEAPVEDSPSPVE